MVTRDNLEIYDQGCGCKHYPFVMPQTIIISTIGKGDTESPDQQHEGARQSGRVGLRDIHCKEHRLLWELLLPLLLAPLMNPHAQLSV